MAHFEKVQTGKPQMLRSSRAAHAQQIQNDDMLKQAQELQVSLAKRAVSPAGKDPLQSFDSSMSRQEVRARFMSLVQRSREAVFA